MSKHSVKRHIGLSFSVILVTGLSNSTAWAVVLEVCGSGGVTQGSAGLEAGGTGTGSAGATSLVGDRGIMVHRVCARSVTW